MTIVAVDKPSFSVVPEIAWERIACNLCGSDKTRPYHRETLPYFDRKLTFDIVKCRVCGLVYTNPRLVDYNAPYLYESDSSHANYAEHDKAKQPVFLAALARITGLLANKNEGKLAKLLDIGCGSGFFLHLARKKHFQVSGIEPAGAFAHFAMEYYGLPVEQSDIYEARLPENEFDVITAWDVIEHVPDPRLFLRQCRQWLRPGGIMALRFPGDRWQKIKGFLLHQVLGSERAAFGPTMHLYFFNEQTFRKLAEQAGLQLIHFQTTPTENNAGSPAINRLKTLSHKVLRAVESVSGRTLGNLEVYCRK